MEKRLRNISQKEEGLMDTDNAGVSRRKCPECGGTELWQLVSKPPKLVCKKCGHEFIWSKLDNEKPNPFKNTGDKEK